MVKALKGISKMHLRTLKMTHNAPKPPEPKSDKGEYQGRCNLSRCMSQKPAMWYNWGSHKYYCASCARMLSSDPVNRLDAQRTFGHPLCTEGTRQSYLQYTVRDILPEFQRLASYHETVPVKEVPKSIHGWVYAVVCHDSSEIVGSNKSMYRYREYLTELNEVKELYERYLNLIAMTVMKLSGIQIQNTEGNQNDKHNEAR